jgi:hypothetical protein
MPGIVICTVCGAKHGYDKYTHKNPSNFVCYACRNKQLKQDAPSAKGFYCISKNKNGDNVQQCHCCDNQVATHCIAFNFLYKEYEWEDVKKTDYWIYCCEKCYSKYKKLNGTVIDVSKDYNFLNYSFEVQIETFLGKVK